MARQEVRMQEKDFIAWNEQMFVKYNNERLYHHPNPMIRYMEARRVSLVLAAVKGADSIVDVGCGEGFLLSKMSNNVRVGVDISETALKRAFTSCPDALLVRANAENLPFSDNFFDAAVCSETLERTQKPHKVIFELARIVKPGGTIVLSVPNESLINNIKDMVWKLGLFPILFPRIPRRQNDEWHLHSFDLQMLESLCAGIFEIRKLQSIPLSVVPARYVAVCRNMKAESTENLRKGVPCSRTRF